MDSQVKEGTPAPGAVATPHDFRNQQHSLLMSRDKMNLAAVRTRAQDLQKTLAQAIFDLESAPERYDWPNVLERFAVMNSQLHGITAQMLPLLEHYVVHPKVVDQQMATVLPIMLASRLLPKQEAEHAEQLQDLHQSHGLAGSQTQPAYVQRMSEGVNKLVDLLTISRPGQPQPALLDPNKGSLRHEIAHSSIIPAKTSASGGQRPVALQARGQRPQGADLFLAVATSGFGLQAP